MQSKMSIEPILGLDPLDGGLSVGRFVEVGRRSSGVLNDQAVTVGGPERSLGAKQRFGVGGPDQYGGNGLAGLGSIDGSGESQAFLDRDVHFMGRYFERTQGARERGCEISFGLGDSFRR